MYYFYWLPVGTDARVRGVPWITWLILVADVLVFAALQAFPGAEALAYRLAFKAGQPTIATAISSLFLHASPIQLLLNVAFLACLGPALETRLGWAGFLVGFLACGWGSNLARAAWISMLVPDMGTLPIMGAAGAVSGLMGLFLVRLSFAHLRFASLRLLLTQGILRSGRRTIPVIAAIGLWFALQVAIALREPVPEAALAGHLAAFLVGLGFGLGMGMAPQGRIESLRAAGNRYVARGDWFAALGEYDAYLAAVPDDPEALVQTARVERVMHQEALAAEHFQAAVRIWLQRNRLREACDAFDEMKRLLGEVTLPPGDLLRVARALEVLDRPGGASRAYEEFGRLYPDRDSAAVAMLKSAELEAGALNNPARARYLYDELLRRALTPEIERVVRERAGDWKVPAPREETLA
jgi:membrane associated rhomboid family serine protease